MKPTINQIPSPARSLCAGSGAVLVPDDFSADAIRGICECPRPLNFSPVPLIQKLPTALKTPPGLRNKSDKPPRNHTSIAGRWRPPAGSAGPEQFYREEFVGLKSPRLKRSGRNPSEGI
jgi:hypothetical protein